MNPNQIYPRPHDKQIVYLKNVITRPNIEVGDYTIYDDFVHDPCDFETNNVLYHYPINGDKLKIGKFCSIACGAKVPAYNAANHALGSRWQPIHFPSFLRSGACQPMRTPSPTRGTTTATSVVGNDVWIGYEAVVLAGVTDWRRRYHRQPRRGDEGRAALYHRGRRSRQAHPQAL